MRKKVLVIVGVAIVVAIAGFILVTAFDRDTETAPYIPSAEAGVLTEGATGLDTPWDIAFLPNGDRLVTERSGTLRRFGTQEASYPVAGVAERGEGGLLGVAVHPDYSSNGFIYLYYTATEGGVIFNRIDRYTLRDDGLQFDRRIVATIPGGNNHNGGRIAFGPDGMLYATTGEGGVESRAQDRDSLAGKILRMHDDGSVPTDNPFNTLVWSWGHRNPQGLAWDDQGRLWSTEHGRSGALSGYDEVNLIERGGNYGWPLMQGDEKRDGMHAPILHSGSNTTWAPCGIAFHNNILYFAGLRGQALYQVAVNDDGSLGSLTARYAGEYGRLRAASVRDNTLYFSTSNKDGRGRARTGDDRVMMLTL